MPAHLPDVKDAPGLDTGVESRKRLLNSDVICQADFRAFNGARAWKAVFGGLPSRPTASDQRQLIHD
jgi:hypothetical protein